MPEPTKRVERGGAAPPGDFVRRVWAWTVLSFLGVAWGYAISLGKMAVSEGAHPFGVTLWTSIIGAGLLIAYSALRRRPISVKPNVLWLYVVCGLLGVVIPAVLFYYAVSRLPAGVLAITVTVGPILTFVFSAACGLERFASLRVLGVAFGALAVVLLVAPETSLPDPSTAPWVLLACGCGVSYALENMILTFRRPKEVGPFMMSCGNYLASAIFMILLAMATGSFVPLTWPWGMAEWAIVGMGAINALTYGLFIYLIAYAGPVFAAQVAYLVTIFGVAWGVFIFDERHSVWVWLSLAAILVGLALVMPRKHEGVTDRP